ncbi:MAG: putative nucleoside-diphosphate-sugar epimerase [Bacteroidetes bacterium HLUCCA01]|nr:MAG: putative nucleoside-diphosphate-sugar epimerase [Bacteroidetes bacterium HLUCCA01]
MKKTKVLLAGGTGYLGGHILKVLSEQQVDTIAIVRKGKKASLKKLPSIHTLEAEVTKANTLQGIFDGVDIVISTIGITRQKDGLTYWDVDYQANKNLLDQAISEGVKKFIYVASLNGEKMLDLKICEAKEQFVTDLKTSGIDYCIVRPNGFFSDLGDFLEMASKGTVYLFGKGNYRINPIDGEDLAIEIVNILRTNKTEFTIGGPCLYSHNELVSVASDILGKKVKVTYLPNWIKKIILIVIRTFSSSKIYGPVEFFLTTLSMDMIAPKYGNKALSKFLRTINKSMHLVFNKC